MLGIYGNWLQKKWRYWGYRTDSDAFGTKMLCFGLWFAHVYYDTGEHI